MIVSSLLFMQSALLMSAEATTMQSSGSLLLQCTVTEADGGARHQFGLMYRDQPQVSVQVHDADRILPSVKPTDVVPIDLRPAGFTLALRGDQSGSRAIAAMIAVPDADNAGEYLVRIEAPSEKGDGRKALLTGRCSSFEGADADRRFSELSGK